jgi:hypothetical protein
LKKIIVVVGAFLACLAPTRDVEQASSFQKGGPAGIIAHGVTIQDCCATLLDQSDRTPGASITVSGPPFPGDPNGQLGSASATTATNFTAASANGVSFTATANAAASNPPPPGLFGALFSSAGQGGTYYTFTLDHASYVSLDASFSPSGSFANPRNDSYAGDVSLRAGSEGGAIVSGDGNNSTNFALSAISTSGSTVTTSVHAGPVLLPAGTYALIGRDIVSAGPGHTASASLTVSLTISADPDADRVGTIMCTEGSVSISPPGGAARPAVLGAPIHLGDVIDTSAAGASACVVFVDGTSINVGQGSKLTVDNYVFDPNSPQGGTARYNFLTGVFQYLSGAMAKKPDPDIQIETVYGQIGIRGTELLSTIGATNAVVLLNEGEIAVTPSATGISNIYDAQTVITFDRSGAATSPFSQDTYDALKHQITGTTADTQPPAIGCASAPLPWQPANVSIACTASDFDSGLANAADASFSLATAVAPGVENANASTTSRQVCDKAGNCATAGPVAGIMIDERPPSISIVSPANGSSYLLNAAVAASYQCTDGGSGVRSCVGPIANGASINTSAAGQQTFTVNAADNVGNVGNAGSVTSSYSVSYAVCQLFDSTRAVRRGSTMPVKIALCDAAGNDVSTLNVAVHATSLTQVSSSASFDVADAGAANPDSDFRFDPTLGSSGGYIFNLKTTSLATGTYALSFTAGADPQRHSVSLQVR